jgi:hypothetical protein
VHGLVQVDQATLFDLILAANYLNIKGLLDVRVIAPSLIERSAAV